MRIFKTIVVVSLILSGLYFIQNSISHKTIEKSQQLEDEVLIGRHNYHINKPDKTLRVESDLHEISGLSTGREDSILLAVQDEKGIVFHISKADGRTIKSEKFARKADYEGIQMINHDIFIISSNGDIYQYDSLKQTTRYKTFLNSRYDVEGLGYFHSADVLLVACKEAGKGNKKTHRSIFGFDLKTKELNSKPFLSLDSKIIARKLVRDPVKYYFKPSAICVDENEDIYILSSVGKALIIVNKTGVLKASVNLDPAVHGQPEGITIDENGILYIANEGRNRFPKVHVYNPK